MSDAPLSLLLSDASATEALGKALARAFTGAVSKTGVVVYLEGELGAGKTTCARSLLHALGVSGLIRSPTYTLVDTYELDSLRCVHVDLYRLESSSEVHELGLRDLATPQSLLLIEWPEKGGAAVPAADLLVRLAYSEEMRRAHVAACSATGEAWMRQLLKNTNLNRYVSNLT